MAEHCWSDPDGGADAPSWWPDNEQWPPKPGPGHQDWAGPGGRFARRLAVTLLVLLTLPIAVGAVLAAVVGGWTSVGVALVGYGAVLAAVALAVRFAIRSWRPLRSLIRAAGRVADGDYEARAQTHDSVFLPMTTSFNRMAERLQTAEDDRRRLLADIGHELRTPLTIIRGELEAMIDGVHRAEPDRLRAVLGDVAVMEHLLDDLRTLSTAEAGMLRVHREPTDLVRLIDDVVERFETEARAGGITLGSTAAGGAVAAEVDPVRLGEVIGNLVRNAIRATPADGTVSVEVAAGGGGSGDGEGGDDPDVVRISVSDTGRGIAPHDLERVFDRFHRGPESDGTGLGLTISRNLVEAHGGDIALHSVSNQGTTVVVTLPRGQPN